MLLPKHPLETVLKNKQNPSEQTSRQGNLSSMSKVLDICSETLQRQFHVALLCLLWFFIAFFHTLLCLLVIAFLNHPIEEWFKNVTSYPSNGSIISEFNPTSGRLQAAFTPNQVKGSRVVQLGNITRHCVTLSFLVHCVGHGLRQKFRPDKSVRPWKGMGNSFMPQHQIWSWT